MKIRLFNVWQRRGKDAHLLVSTTSAYDANQARDRAEGDFVTEQDTWVEFPEEDDS